MPIIHHPHSSVVDAAIDALPVGACVATDADGTLWAGDVGDDTVRWIGAEVEPSYDVAAYLRRMVTDYHGGCREAATALHPHAHHVDALRRFLATRIRPRAHLVAALRRALDRGVHVWIVSASPALSARVGATLVGLDGIGVLALETTPDGVIEPATVGPGKVAAWQARGLPPVNLALGDSRWDEPLLAHAHVGFWLDEPDAMPSPET